MYIDIIAIDLFDQNSGKVCSDVRTEMLMNITDIDSFDQNVCAIFN